MRKTCFAYVVSSAWPVIVAELKGKIGGKSHVRNLALFALCFAHPRTAKSMPDLETPVKSKNTGNALIKIMFIEMPSMSDAITKILMRVYRSSQPYVPYSWRSDAPPAQPKPQPPVPAHRSTASHCLTKPASSAPSSPPSLTSRCPLSMMDI
jgi:hypothetical protein